MAHAFPQLAYDRTGSGTPLVLVHPLGSDRQMWRPVTPQLAERYEVIAVDMPGFGGSPELPEEIPATAENLAAAIEATLETIGVARFHLVGNSLGGWVALELAKRGGALTVTGISAAGFWPNPLGPRPEIARNAARLLSHVAGPLLSTSRGRRLALAGSTAHPDRIPAAAARHLVRTYGNSPGFTRANAEMRKTLFTGFDEIPCPVTLAWSDRDRLVTRPTKSLPAGVHDVQMHGTGHLPTWDDPDQVVRVILDGAALADEAGAAA